LQDTMQDNVGIIRVEHEMVTALAKIEELKERSKKVRVEGHVQYNPGWNLATDLPSLLTVAEAATRHALLRQESRGGHTRDDFPTPDKEHWAKVNVRSRLESIDDNGVVKVAIDEIPLPQMPAELAELFEEAK
ncbi:MAG: succinate dehydrogenase / fumarate reductase, flavoprotein subunit, partial [Frankiales bacterium]|nr:succinate dehydrogenase / fumarate reductase, flavoprotein subunit [Frankiales bacterium]